MSVSSIGIDELQYAKGAMAREVPRHRKPANLLYGLEEAPPTGARLGLAVQHVFVMSVGWIFVVVMVTASGGTTAQTESVIRFSMIASGIATILQARSGLLGSGYLCPFSCGPAYLPAAILAGQNGGLPLIFGMTAVSGAFEAALARVIGRLRVLFPPEVTGLVVSMVGIQLIALGCPRFLGYAGQEPRISTRSLVIGMITLGAMIAPTIWGKGKWRLYPVLLGLLAGYISSFALGILHWAQFDVLRSEPLVGLPNRLSWAFAFQFAFLLPFLIASLSSVLKSVGDLTLCQKINDTEWKRTDMRMVSGGTMSGAIGTFLAGMLGGAGQSTFSSNVALSMATGATSRSIALPIGLITLALAFFPRIAAAFAMMPQPVMGAVLIYVACFTILGGFALLTSRMLDARKTFVIGLPMIFGLSVAMAPQLYRNLPAWLHPIFASALSLSTVLVIVLNLVFRIGIAKRRTIEFIPGPGAFDTVSRFMEEQGGAWGMRPEVVRRADDALHEFMVHAPNLRITSPVAVEARFDEFNFDLDINYEGLPFVLLEHLPSWETVSEVDDVVGKMSAFLVRQYADSVYTASCESKCRIQLHFEH
jgi:xanthine permease XanP